MMAVLWLRSTKRILDIIIHTTIIIVVEKRIRQYHCGVIQRLIVCLYYIVLGSMSQVGYNAIYSTWVYYFISKQQSLECNNL